MNRCPSVRCVPWRPILRIQHGSVRATSTSKYRPSQPTTPVATRKMDKPPSFQKKSSWKDYWSEHYQKARKDHPMLLYPLIAWTAVSVFGLGYYIYWDFKYVKPTFAAYSENVERLLRKALTAIHKLPNPAEAEKYFLLALHEAEQEGMDPFSAAFMGIRLRLAEMQEHFGRAKAAVEVLDGIIRDCEQKVADLDRGAATQDMTVAVSLRQSLMGMNIRARVKVVNLYESNHLQNSAKAKQVLSDAINILVKECREPQSHGFTRDNKLGLSLEEIASMFLTMGDLYATTGEESNAVQTYMLTLQPLRASCNGSKSCKEAQVFSNIASTMSVAMKRPGAIINGKPADKESLAAARGATIKWADQAITTAEMVNAEDRDGICELASLSAKMTKADLLLKDGRQIQAREAYRELVPALQAAKLDGLARIAEEAMKRLGG